LRYSSNNKKFKVFESLDEIKDWGNKHYAEWADTMQNEHKIIAEPYMFNLSDEQYKKIKKSSKVTEYISIARFTGYQYDQINSILRGIPVDLSSPESFSTREEMINRIDDALSRTSVAQDIITFRWITYEGICSLLKSCPPDIITGNTFR